MTTTITVTMATTTPDTRLDFSVGSPLFYIVIGAGGVMTVLLLCILTLMVLTLTVYHRHRKQKIENILL